MKDRFFCSNSFICWNKAKQKRWKETAKIWQINEKMFLRLATQTSNHFINIFCRHCCRCRWCCCYRCCCRCRCRGCCRCCCCCRCRCCCCCCCRGCCLRCRCCRWLNENFDTTNSSNERWLLVFFDANVYSSLIINSRSRFTFWYKRLIVSKWKRQNCNDSNQIMAWLKFMKMEQMLNEATTGTFFR